VVSRSSLVVSVTNEEEKGEVAEETDEQATGVRLQASVGSTSEEIEEKTGTEEEQEPVVSTPEETEEENEEAEETEEEVYDEEEEEDDYGLFETASRKLASQAAYEEEKLAVLHTLFRNAPKKTVPFLYELIKNSDMYLRRHLMLLLRQVDYPTVVDLYRYLIVDEESALRLQGMMGLVKLDSDEARNVISSAVVDRDPNVRRFIVNCLDHTGGEARVTAIARLSADSDESVRKIAVKKLSLLGNHFAFVNLVPRLEDPDVNVRKEAIYGLKRIAGTDYGYNFLGTEGERRRAVKQWKALAERSYANPGVLRSLREKNMKAAEEGTGNDSEDSEKTNAAALRSSARGSKGRARTAPRGSAE
ncbi:MAG: HEAT repeat domain-containing protein, partial [Candidatus Omnitrophica bacterium]|nr:HEAT repeat domain-containing protein [Candidatus Omnitrophota bacterium]